MNEELRYLNQNLSVLHSSSASARLTSESLLSVIENYIQYYAAGESHTAKAKRYDLKHFLEYLTKITGNSTNHIPVADWTYQRTTDFVEDRLAQREAPSTVCRRLATIKHFGRTLAERVPGYINPAREVKSPTLQPTRPHGLTQQEVDFLLEAALVMQSEKANSFVHARNRFMLLLLMATGLRADEVRLLVMGQISEDGNWLNNVRTKGKKFRNVYLDTMIRLELESYLTMRHDVLFGKYPEVLKVPATEQARYPVLISTYRGHSCDPKSLSLSSKTVWRGISNLGKRAQSLGGTSLPNLHPHKLRHTFAHGLLDSSKDIRLVAQALGHSDVRTTMRYTERTDEQVAQAIEQCHTNAKSP